MNELQICDASVYFRTDCEDLTSAFDKLAALADELGIEIIPHGNRNYLKGEDGYTIDLGTIH